MLPELWATVDCRAEQFSQFFFQRYHSFAIDFRYCRASNCISMRLFNVSWWSAWWGTEEGKFSPCPLSVKSNCWMSSLKSFRRGIAPKKRNWIVSRDAGHWQSNKKLEERDFAFFLSPDNLEYTLLTVPQKVMYYGKVGKKCWSSERWQKGVGNVDQATRKRFETAKQHWICIIPTDPTGRLCCKNWHHLLPGWPTQSASLWDALNLYCTDLSKELQLSMFRKEKMRKTMFFGALKKEVLVS